MKTIVIVGHPHYENSNTQPFLHEAAKKYSNVTWHVVTDKFNVAAEQALLKQYDRIILQFPLYWYSMPAILKNWLDEVLTVKFATGNQFSLSSKELGLVITLGSKSSNFQAGGPEKFTISELMRPIEALANKLKMTYLPILPIYQFLYLQPTQQAALYIKYQQYLTSDNTLSFKSRSNWFKAELERRVDNQTDAIELQSLLATFEDNQNILDDLQMDLDTLKKEENE